MIRAAGNIRNGKGSHLHLIIEEVGEYFGLPSLGVVMKANLQQKIEESDEQSHTVGLE